MALRNFGTGPMAIGGTDAPGSINLELGRAQNATSSLNETDLRTLSGIPSGAISLFDFYGKSSSLVGALITINTARSSNTNNGYAVTLDSTGAIIIAGHHFSNREFPVIFKISQTGAIVWQRQLWPSANFATVMGATCDSSNAVFVSGYRNVGGGNTKLLLAKYNSNGVFQFATTRSTGSLTTSGLEQGRKVIADTTGSVYVCGTSTNTVSQINAKMILAKMTTSGGVSWNRYSGKIGPTYHFGFDVTNDSQDRPAVLGTVLDNVSGKYRMSLVAYNSTGTSRFQQTLGDSAVDVYGYAATAIGTDIYIGGTNQSGNQAILAKYNGSGTLQWQRGINGPSGTTEIWGLRGDSAGNVYACGLTGSNMFWCSFSPTGDIIMQRTISGSGLSKAESIAVDGNYIYIIGADIADSMRIFRLPKDGSLTGNYPAFSYQPISFTVSTTTLTSSSLSFTYEVNDTFSSFVANLEAEDGTFSRTFTSFS